MPDGMDLTNVRLSVAEHRAAKRRAVELGVPLADLLRQGLLLVLREQESGAPVAPEPTLGSDLGAAMQARRAVVARTAGALRDCDTWARELVEMRREPPRDAAWSGRSGDEPGRTLGRHSPPTGGGVSE